MGYELYYEGRITFDRPVRLARPDEEDCLSGLARFFTPVFEQAEGTSTGRYVTGFQVEEEPADWAKSWPWHEDFVAIEEFARCHQVTLTAQLRWQGDGCPSNPADDRGHVVFDVHGEHHQVPDSSNNDQAVEAHRRRSCTCYGDPAPHPTPAPSPAPVPELLDVADFNDARLDEDENVARAVSGATVIGEPGAWQSSPTGDEWEAHSSDHHDEELLVALRPGLPRPPEVMSGQWGAVVAATPDPADPDADSPMPALVHAARHDPARVLAEVQAKRLFNESWRQLIAEIDSESHPERKQRLTAIRQGLDRTAFHLAAAHHKHPDYRPEWRM
ncbi:DUF6221 family protein (plasmid) [Streptomyces sp. NBC_00015]|uniref:DUF6221 family protein n=1 Tax=Streptomyces sp. NBC_00015 TaxID=2903611 RepID=UPI002F90CAFB